MLEEIIIEREIKKSSSSFVYSIIKKFEEFPKFMPNVRKVTIVEQNDSYTISEWDTIIDDAPFTWKEKDDFDNKKNIIKFSLIEGIFSKFEGCWKVENSKNGSSKVTFQLNYDIGVPVIEEAVGPILKDKIKDNIQLMLDSIAKHAESE